MLSKTSTLLFASVVLLLQTANAQTVTVKDLHSAQVVAASGSSDARRQAFEQALVKVLVKISGSREIAASTGVQTLLTRPDRFVQGYKYSLLPEDYVPADGEEVADDARYLRVDFNEPALKRALVSAGLPIWSALRPNTLVVLAVQQGRQRYIVSEDKRQQLPMLDTLAAERGLPIVLPLMDLEDRRNVEFADISAGFLERLELLKKRYAVDVMLIGHLAKKSGKWSTKWTLRSKDSDSSWLESDLGLDETLRSGVDGVADLLAARYAFASGPGHGLAQYIVEVDQMETLDQYAQILNLMSELVFVESVTPVLLQDSRVRYRVSMRGERSQLERSLTLSPYLRPSMINSEIAPDATDSQQETTEADSDYVDLFFSARM